LKPVSDKNYKVAMILISRLERLSADSLWAKRASGLRGSLMKGIDSYSNNPTIENDGNLGFLVTEGFAMLEKAAREIPDIESILNELNSADKKL